MPFYDWSGSFTNAQGVLSATNPLVGSYSLATNAPQGNAQMRFFWSRVAGGGYTPGLLAGRIRTLLKLEHVDQGAGVIFLASATTIGATSGNFYEAGRRASNNQVFISRTNGGLPSFTANLNVASWTFTLNTPYAMQVDWIVDTVNLGGVYIELSMGAALDFSDLTKLTSWLDSSASKLTTSVAEGLGGAWNVVSQPNVYFDQTTIAALTPA